MNGERPRQARELGSDTERNGPISTEVKHFFAKTNVGWTIQAPLLRFIGFEPNG